MEGLQHEIKDGQWKKYTECFNFFQSKSINLIMSNRKVDHVIHYRDMEFFDDDVEYLKRYYHSGESLVRVQKLISNHSY
jgi:microsomal dipeptidase-like Zn-dependent dipeptidase